MRTITSKDRTVIAYEVAGDGPSVLMLTAYLLWLTFAVSAGCARTESTPAPVEDGVPTAAYVNGRWCGVGP